MYLTCVCILRFQERYKLESKELHDAVDSCDSSKSCAFPCFTVVEHAYELATAAQKQELLLELCSIELQLFKDLVSVKEGRKDDK
ncbi:hypothetical protein K1719_032520 [Acacia pycnantha]|nr:hypothetical protein K1719_032520 [Acacia pycnantha]